MRWVFILSLACCVTWSAEGAAATLDRIKAAGAITLGVRVDAAPYSYLGETERPQGYTVELCLAVAERLRQSLGLEAIQVNYEAVTPGNRFEAVRDGKIDLLCGAATATLARRELVDFSLATFIDGASVLFRKDGPGSFAELAGRKVAVRAGTTTEQRLAEVIEKLGVSAVTLPVDDHESGLAKLESGEIAAYFADQAILFFLKQKSRDPAALALPKEVFSHEPYALALMRGDSDFRLAVDRALSDIYRSGDIKQIFAATFGNAEPSEIVRALYLINALPE